jgi:hypothetical protein
MIALCRSGLAGLAAAAVILAAAGLRAQDAAPIDAFFGTWEGTAIAEDSESLFFDVTSRDMNVEIRQADGGFRVFWTALLRRGGDPENPDVYRRSAELTFRPAAEPGLYEAESSGNPLEGGVLSWARLHGRTLSVYQLTLNEEGGYELTSYDRTLTGQGMELVFRRLRDGEPVRSVTGRLVKTGG